MSDLIHILPDHAAEHAPDATAFRCNGQAISYAELLTRAGQLASVLIERGVRPGDRVGLLVRKSLISAIGIYGITRAGAIYVPLDPTAPVARLAGLVTRCGISHLVSDSAMQRTIDPLCEAVPGLTSVIGLRDLPWEVVGQAPVAAPQNRRADDPAYIMFTSGSTGTPKGMVHTHRSGLAYARRAVSLYEITPQDVMANHPALHFDMSTFAMFGGPIAGAPVEIIPDAIARLPAEMSKLMQEAAISIWYSVPHALIQLLQAGALEKRDLSALRWVIFAGEPFIPQHLRHLMSLLPNAGFSNNYGPAEVNVCTVHHIATPQDVPDSGLAIGRVWDLAEGRVLDDTDTPLAPGHRGELVIASDTMMKGYWQDPERTEQSLYREAGRLFYRTGDLVEEDENGVLHYFGRRDRQIKLRGFRIELAEVELALCAHEEVIEASAFPAPDDSLCAAVTLRGEAQISAILAKARAHLPAYALPGRLHVLAEFPRTATDKIDHAAIARRFACE